MASLGAFTNHHARPFVLQDYGSPLKQELLKGTAPEEEDEATADVTSLLSQGGVTSLLPVSQHQEGKHLGECVYLEYGSVS